MIMLDGMKRREDVLLGLSETHFFGQGMTWDDGGNDPNAWKS